MHAVGRARGPRADSVSATDTVRAYHQRVMTPEIATALKRLPDGPGVYLMKDAQGRVLYVGKAQNLTNRVRQYWQAGRGGTAAPLRIESAIDRVADLEWTLTDTVSARRCCSRPTWSSGTSRASTSGSRTTRATRSSR